MSMIGHPHMASSRGGRPRKSGPRQNGRRLSEVPPDYRQRIAAQPHRRNCADPMHEKAESPLGRLNLRGVITDQQLEAGRRYAVITGAYRGSIGAPHGTAGGGYGGCGGDCIDPGTCECLRRKLAYDLAYGSLWDAGQKACKAVAHVAVRELDPEPFHVEPLLCGLSALVEHFGLTQRAKSCQR